MFHRIAVAIGAGCAAALLFAVSAQTSAVAMALTYLAPLPIMIATLGWGLDSGAIATTISVAALALLSEPLSALLFAASVAIPGWALAAVAVTPVPRYLGARPSAASAHASVGTIVSLASVIGILGGAAILTAIIVIYGGYGEGARRIAAELTALAGSAFGGAESAKTAQEFAETLVRFGPSAIAGSMLLMLCINLYSAARSAQLSHRLSRPWPDLPTSLYLPWPLGGLFLGCIAAAYVLPSPAGQYFAVGAGGLGGAFVLQGLAVAHALSRGLALRPVMLAALYACCFLRAKYTLPVVAALGLVDVFARLRNRPAFMPASNPRTRK
jgi:hypothetical protein